MEKEIVVTLISGGVAITVVLSVFFRIKIPQPQSLSIAHGSSANNQLPRPFTGQTHLNYQLKELICTLKQTLRLVQIHLNPRSKPTPRRVYRKSRKFIFVVALVVLPVFELYLVHLIFLMRLILDSRVICYT